MNDRIDEFRSKRDGVVIPRIWVTIALSILVHLAALWELPPISVKLPGQGEIPDARPSLSVQLMPPRTTSQPGLPSQPAAPQPPPAPPRPKAAPRPPAPPPVIALNKPAPSVPSPAPAAPTVPAPKPAPPPMAGDMASYIEARRRARGTASPEPPPDAPAEDAEARRQRIIAGNIGSQRDEAFGYDPNRGGGAFQIERMNYDSAEFAFYGWNKDISRNAKQVIVVQRGNNADIRIAVVRRMVSIIREYEKEDFLWVSRRLGRSLTLSARPRDSAGLEAFMMQEFFADATPAQR